MEGGDFREHLAARGRAFSNVTAPDARSEWQRGGRRARGRRRKKTTLFHFTRGGRVWGREGGSTAYLQFRRMTRARPLAIFIPLPPIPPPPSPVAGIIDPFFSAHRFSPDETIRRIFGFSGFAERYLSPAARRNNLHRILPPPRSPPRFSF